MSKDPIWFGGGDSNLYRYTFQDPINYIDVDGNIAIPLIIPLIPVLTNTALWGGLIASGATLIGTLTDAYSKGGNQNVKDTGLQDLTDAELQQKLKTATGKEKLRYIKELKGRKLRNKKKREGC